MKDAILNRIRVPVFFLIMAVLALWKPVKTLHYAADALKEY